MRQSDWGARATPDEMGEGITRRDALRRGAMAGLGLVWVTPQIASYSMTSQLAQATSPVSATIPGNGTTTPDDGTPEDGTTPENESPEVTEPEVEGTVIENPSTTPPSAGGTQVEAHPEIEDEVLSGQLPFTGLPLEQLLPLAGGAVATGAAVVRLTREKSGKEVEETE